MGLIDKISDRMEHRRIINQYGGKRRKGAIAATRKATEGYEFEEDVKKPGLLKRFSSLSR